MITLGSDWSIDGGEQEEEQQPMPMSMSLSSSLLDVQNAFSAVVGACKRRFRFRIYSNEKKIKIKSD